MPTFKALTIKATSARTPKERAALRVKHQPPPLGDRRAMRNWTLGQFRAMRDKYEFQPESAIAWVRANVPHDYSEGSLEEYATLIWGTDLDQTDATEKLPAADLREIVAVVAGSRLTVADLRGSQHNKAGEHSQREILERIWWSGGLACVGREKDSALVITVRSLLHRPRPLDLTEFQFCTANQPRAYTGKAKRKDGTTYDSRRCKGNACLEESRRWFVLEWDFKPFDDDGKPTVWKPLLDKWEAMGVTAKDASVRLLNHVLTTHQHKLALAVDSGGKSIHYWVNVRDAGAEEKQALMSDAARLGADPASWRLSQWVRLGGGTRRDEDGTTAAQPVIYFNAENTP